MFLSDFRSAIARRWYVLVIGLVATAGACGAVTSLVPVSHEARALVLLLPPRALVETGGNPYVALGGLDAPVGVLARAMTGEQTALELAAVSPTAMYAVDPDPSTSGPVLMVSVEDVTGEAAVGTMNALLTQIPAKLDQLQRDTGAPTESFITATVITADTEAEPVVQGQLRAVLAVGAAGLAASLLATALADGLLTNGLLTKGLLTKGLLTNGILRRRREEEPVREEAPAREELGEAGHGGEGPGGLVEDGQPVAPEQAARLSSPTDQEINARSTISRTRHGSLRRGRVGAPADPRRRRGILADQPNDERVLASSK